MKSLNTAVFLDTPFEAMNYAKLLSTLGDRDRAALERQIGTYEGKLGTAAGELWRRFACMLRTLASGGTKLSGANAMQFYIPDGKYRKQVFAMQALASGELTVYVPDVRAQAARAGILGRHTPAEENRYRLGKGNELLMIDALDGKSPNPEAFYKDMTGWNRKAIRVTLPANPSKEQIQATEQLCVLAAEEWAAAAE